MHNLRPLYGRPYHGGRVSGYAHSESAVLLCNTWDLVASEGSGDVSFSWVLMIDDLRAALMRQAPPDELNPLIAFFDS
jgi:hypothetical protein